MTGGIIQLVAYGKEDLFLTRDPQITFFKVIYRRHTNFSREDVCQFFTNDPDFGKRSTCVIAPEGDLAEKMALRITLPRINKFLNSDGIETNTKFAWVKRIGYAMIKSIEIEINECVIDRHYGEWLHIFSMLTTRNINDNGLNKLIGNVPELTDFTNGKEEYTMYIPLQFWYCRASGLALPLVSLQYSDIKINIEFYELEKCYFITPTHYIKCSANLVNFKEFEFLVQKSVDNIERYGMFSHYDIIDKKLYYSNISPDKFIGIPYNGDINLIDNTTKLALLNTPRAEKYAIKGVSSDFTIIPDIEAKSLTVHRRKLKNVSIKECVLLVNYVYLDEDERYKFAQTKHDYLIEQLYFTPNMQIDSTNRKIKLDIDQPCKLTVWVAQLDYINKYNDRFNYTDTHIIKRPYDINYTCPEKIKLYSMTKVNEEIGNSLIDEETIMLNSQVRLNRRKNDYFEYIQSIQHFDNILPKGCGMYSYGLFPGDVSPSGTTNMSQIELIELLLKMNYKVNVNQKAKFRSYSLCYNVWRVNNGLSARVFIK